MPKIAYSEGERAQIRQALLQTGLALFGEQGIQHTTVEQVYRRVGISRTFFYSFFPAKGDFVVEAFYLQQPQILTYAQRLMEDPALSWREGARQLLHRVCTGGEGRFAIMSVEEQQALANCLSEERHREFAQRRLVFFTQLLQVLGIHTGPREVKLLGNLVFSAAILHKAIPGTLPFLFSDAAGDMTSFQIETILNHMETLREPQHP